MEKTKTIFKGKVLSLYKETRILPNKVLVDLEIIKHPGAVLIVPFINKSTVVMIRQFRPVINSYIWELPAGTLEKGESILTCAKRELLEETGYKAKTLKRIGNVYPVPGYSTERIIMYKATGLRSFKTDNEVDEIIKVRLFSSSEVKKLANSGKIVDAKTICALSFSGLI
jgi:ADP-ribose diphosphatase